MSTIFLWYFKYILITFVLLGEHFNAGLLLVTEYFYTVVLLILLKYKMWVKYTVL